LIESQYHKWYQQEFGIHAIIISLYYLV